MFHQFERGRDERIVWWNSHVSSQTSDWMLDITWIIHIYIQTSLYVVQTTEAHETRRGVVTFTFRLTYGYMNDLERSTHVSGQDRAFQGQRLSFIIPVEEKEKESPMILPFSPNTDELSPKIVYSQNTGSPVSSVMWSEENSRKTNSKSFLSEGKSERHKIISERILYCRKHFLLHWWLTRFFQQKTSNEH